MIGIDANVLPRYLLADDEAQHRAACELIDRVCSTHQPAYVCEVALAETTWFLAKRLRRPKTDVAGLLRDIVNNAHLLVGSRSAVLLAIVAYENGRGDFNDYFVAALNRAQGVSRTLTFDIDAARDGSLELLPVDD